MGRVHESLFQYNEAENIYKDVLRTNNKYIDCKFCFFHVEKSLTKLKKKQILVVIFVYFISKGLQNLN